MAAVCFSQTALPSEGINRVGQTLSKLGSHRSKGRRTGSGRLILLRWLERAL